MFWGLAMVQLTPTVHERLARCGTSVAVTGLVAGADVQVDAGGTLHAFSATAGSESLDVAPLSPGDVVRARQDDGSGLTPWSVGVVVEDAAVPPAAGPLLPSQVGGCSQCVRVEGMVPGCQVELRQGGSVVGAGTAGRQGAACVGVKLQALKDDTEVLTARMRVCGSVSPDTSTPLFAERTLDPPVVGAPIFGCQRVVPLAGLTRGARTRIVTDSGTFLGWVCNCRAAVNVNVLHALVPGERVHAQQFWDGEHCTDVSAWSDWRRVLPPDARIQPELEAPLIAGDRLIRVSNQIVGADLVILIRNDPQSAETRFGPRPASQEAEISLNEPLIAGQNVAVEQRLCGHVEVSDWVTVLPAPPRVVAPIVLPPLFACGGAVQVAGLQPGALVRVFADGIPCGLGWAGLSSSIAVPAAPALAAGVRVTARQWVGGLAGPESDSVQVGIANRLYEPRLVGPVAIGDTEVVVSGVTPGALVSIRAGAAVLGEGRVAEPLARIGVAPLPHAAIRPMVRLCGGDRQGSPAESIAAPGAAGPKEGVSERDVEYGMVAIPVRAVPGAPDDGGFDVPVRGRVYFPASFDSTRYPVVIVAHGYWFTDEQDQSYLGYEWLARHLAKWGMVVFSIDLGAVNRRNDTGEGATQQWSRGEVMLAAVDRLRNDANFASRIDSASVGLVGHSMGGEAVLAAQVLSMTHTPAVNVRGVVSLAPTNWRPDLQLQNCHYLQLHGSLDYLLEGTPPELHFNGFRLFDRSWRHRTHVWIDGARHQGWNPNWWNSVASSFAEGSQPAIPGSLGPDEQSLIGRAYVNAFFQDALFNNTAYRGYLQGLVRPSGLSAFRISVQHHGIQAQVVDNMGDSDAALGLGAESPADKSVNTRLGPVAATGTGLDVWDDVRPGRRRALRPRDQSQRRRLA